jgi:RHS repeat-associated protein
VGGAAVGYAYDDLGRQVARTQGGVTEQYLYLDPQEPWRVSASKAAGVTTLYRYDDDGRLVALERGGTAYVVGTDQVGSVQVVVNAATGAVVRSATYDAYGAVTATGAFALALGFAGGLQDPVTGLVRFGLRDYDPAAGRFTGRDPALYAGGQLNLYAYVDGDPVNRVDPSGQGDGGELVCGSSKKQRWDEITQWGNRQDAVNRAMNSSKSPDERRRLSEKSRDLWNTAHRLATDPKIGPPPSDSHSPDGRGIPSPGGGTRT